MLRRDPPGRSESDRGLAVIVDARRDKNYFRRLSAAFPPGCEVVVARREELGALLRQVGIEPER